MASQYLYDIGSSNILQTTIMNKLFVRLPQQALSVQPTMSAVFGIYSRNSPIDDLSY